LGNTEVDQMWPLSDSTAAVTPTGPEYLAAISKAPLLHLPGTVWDYSGSTSVLGLVVEAIAGKSLGAFLEERLWKPLRMEDTSFTIPEAKKERYARALANDP